MADILSIATSHITSAIALRSAAWSAASSRQSSRMTSDRKDGRDGGRLKQAGGLPLSDPHLARCGIGAKLAGDGHDDDIGLFRVVGAAADDDGGPPLHGGTAGERERRLDGAS